MSVRRPDLSSMTSRDWIDIAIKVVLVAVIGLAAYFIYTYVSFSMVQRSSTNSARAVANLTEVVKKMPNDANMRVRLADALVADGQDREATKQYEAALEIDPEHSQALAGLALLSMSQGEWRTAEEYWHRVIDLLEGGQYAAQDLRLEKAYYYLGSTLMELKEYEDAAAYLREALRMKKDASDSHFLIAIAYREMDIDDKAIEHLKYALLFDPLLPEANFEYGRMLLEDGDIAGAAEHFRIAADYAPDDRTEPLDELDKLGPVEERIANANEFAASNETSAALTEARVAAAIEPDDAEAVMLLATLFERSGDASQAVAAYEKVVDLKPDDAEAKAAIERLENQ